MDTQASNRRRRYIYVKAEQLVKTQNYQVRKTMSCLASCCVSATCGLCSSVASGISGKSARIAYCGLFGASLVVSWILRETSAPLLEKCSCTFSVPFFLLPYLGFTDDHVSAGFAKIRFLFSWLKERSLMIGNWNHRFRNWGFFDLVNWFASGG